jgi:hypothetical protein
MSRQIKIISLVFVAAFVVLWGVIPAQNKGGGKPSPYITLRAAFRSLNTDNIQNWCGALPEGEYAFWHMGEGTRDVHVRIIEPDEYGRLQFYVPNKSGYWVKLLFTWPPMNWETPDPKQCKWPIFLNPEMMGTDELQPEVFSFQTNQIYIVENDPIPENPNGKKLTNTGIDLNLSRMGIDFPLSVIVGTRIAFWPDDLSTDYTLEYSQPVTIEAETILLPDGTVRPERWTIRPIIESYTNYPNPEWRTLRRAGILKGKWTVCLFGIGTDHAS